MLRIEPQAAGVVCVTLSGGSETDEAGDDCAVGSGDREDSTVDTDVGDSVDAFA